MNWQFIKIIGAIFCALFIFNCAGLTANLNSPMESSFDGKRVIVFPFQDPFYKGRQIQGVGGPFASVFVNKLRANGIKSDLAKSSLFPSTVEIELDKACKYAIEHNYDLFALGIITEWLDGATQWSGTVDVAALSVNLYTSADCEFTGSASGKQNGTWFTFVDAPTTRFFEPLSERIVATLLGRSMVTR